MNPGETLPLRDIHLPDAVSWWPPAIGWWILLVLLLLLLAGLVVAIRKLLQPRLNKSARAEIEQVLNEYTQHADDQKMLQQLSSAIRRIGISYLTREQHAGLVGASWYQRINQLAPEQAFSAEMVALLIDAPYQKQPHIDAELVQQLVAQARSWVQALPANPSAQIQLDASHV